MAQRASVYAHVRIDPRVRRAVVATAAAIAVLLGLATPALAAGGLRAGRSPSSETSGRPSAVVPTGSISGHVTLGSATPSFDDGVVFVRNSHLRRKLYVNSSTGNFTARNLPDGSYRVVFDRMSGYAEAAPQFYDGRDETQVGLQAHESVRISGGVAVTGVDAVLHQGGVIQGVVRDHTGAPLDRCLVQAYTPDGRLVTRDSTTAADGGFEIHGLSTGRYFVRVLTGRNRIHHCSSGGAEDVMSAAGGVLGTAPPGPPVSVTAGATSTFASPLTYVPGGQITGHVDLPPDALPIDHVVVARRGHHTRRATVDGNGDYTIKGLSSGSYRVTFARVSGTAVAAPLFYQHSFEEQGVGSATPVSVSLGQATTLAPTTLATGGKISGRLVDGSGGALIDCLVQAYRPDGSLVTRSAVTSSTGAFSVPGLSTGQYRLRVVQRPTGACIGKQQVYDGTSQLSRRGGAVVGVSRGATTSIPGNLVYAQGAVISGHVSFASQTPPRSDRYVVARRGFYTRVTRVHKDGTYQFRGLAAGSYRITFNRISGYAIEAAQFYQLKDESAGVSSAARLRVGPGQVTSDVDAALRSGAHITGKLVDAAGQPLVCALQAFTTDGSLVTRDGASYGPGGSFDIGGLSTGSYYVRAVPSGRGCDQGIQYRTSSTSLAFAAPGVPVSVTQGHVTSVGTLAYQARTALTNTIAPSIGGPAVVGSTLAASSGAWTPSPDHYAYAWYSDGQRITSATASTYVVTTADLGRRITVRVTASGPGLTTVTALSAPTAPVTAPAPPPPPVTSNPSVATTPTLAFTLKHKPAVTGSAVVGKVLKIKKAALTPAPSKVKIQWLRNGKKIKHATHKTYRLTKADAGHRISVRVTYERPGYPALVVVTKAVKVKPAGGARAAVY